MCVKSGLIKTRWASLAVLLLLTLTSAVQAESLRDSMRLAPGDQKVLTFPSAVAKVATSDPGVAALTVTGSAELLLTAKSEGSAVLSVWLRNNSKPLRSTVVVATTLGDALPFGTQVQTGIRVLEVSRSELNQLGMSYSNVFNGGESAVGIAPPGTGFQTPGAVPTPLGGEGFNLFGFGPNSVLAINALEAGGFAYTLAEPSLTSLSGQSASFLSGGEFPVPTRSTTDGVQIEFKEFGIGLSLTPTVIDKSQIILRVAPEVSELDFSAGVETGGVAVPGLRVRRAETTVSLAPGETFIISGLVSRNTINSSGRLPGIGNIPLLGAFFRSSRIQKDDKELVMVVTPHLVTPQQATSPPVTLPGAGYHSSSMGWLDMATESRRGSQPIRHGLSW